MKKKECSRLGKVLIIASIGLLILPFSGMAASTGYPAKPIKLMVPFPPGGSTDISARAIAGAMEKRLRVSVVVENMAGGGGSVGWKWLSRQKPDGYTIGLAASSMVVQQYAGIAGVDIKAFEPLSMIAYSDNVLAVATNSPFKTVKDLVDYAGKNPKKVRIANNGTGSVWHLCAAAFEQAAGVKFTHVPFQSGKEAVIAMVGGHVEVSSSALGDVSELVKGGKARILGIPSKEKFPMFPDVPTFKEQGYDLEMGAFIGLIAPKGTSKEEIKLLDDACKEGVQSEEYKKIQANFGNRVRYLNAEDFGRLIRSEDAFYHKTIKELGLEVGK